MATKYVNETFRQVMPQRAISDDNFGQGTIDYAFDVGSRQRLIMSKSYFKVEVSLQRNTTVGAPAEKITPETVDGSVSGAGVPIPDRKVYLGPALVENPISAAFNSVSVNIGGITVSSLTSNVAQASMIKHRLNTSKAWQDSVGKVYGLNSKLADRKIEATKATTKTILWSPPIGIFEQSKPMGCSNYRVNLFPNADYKTHMWENDFLDPDGNPMSGADKLTYSGVVKIKSMSFYACLIDATDSMDPNEDDDFTLYETSINGHKGEATSNNLDFVVPISTHAVSIFIQSTTLGGAHSVSHFKATTLGKELGLTAIQLAYGGLQKPSSMWESKYVAEEDSLQQRYIDTYCDSGLLWSESGAESYEQWALDRGPLLHFDVYNGPNNPSKNLNLRINFASALESTDLVYVCAHHKVKVDIVKEGGFVRNVLTNIE